MPTRYPHLSIASTRDTEIISWRRFERTNGDLRRYRRRFICWRGPNGNDVLEPRVKTEIRYLLLVTKRHHSRLTGQLNHLLRQQFQLLPFEEDLHHKRL
jgi:hypothetical protein